VKKWIKHSGIFWNKDMTVAIGSYTVYRDGVLEFVGIKHSILVENIGTPDEKVTINDLSDISQE
jgi:hypothetical protein